MKLLKLIRILKEKNIDIEIINEELDIVVNDDNLTDELLIDIKINKNNLLEYYSNKGNIKKTSDFTFYGLTQKEYKKILTDNEIDNFNVDDIYSLTSLQEGFLFHSMMDKDSLDYFEQISIDLSGIIQLDYFKKAWYHVISRHDSLRTMFISDFKVPLQMVLRYRDLDFSFVDLTDQSDIKENINSIKESDKKNVFDLKKDPLFRINLIQKTDTNYVMILSFHHIIIDGWCLQTIMSEFMDCYSKLVKNINLELDKPAKYSSYIKWLNNRESDDGLRYWKNYLSSYQVLASVPKDKTNILPVVNKKDNFSFTIDKEKTKKLFYIASSFGITLNSIIQTIWGIILSQYNGVDDVVFGSTVSGRPQDIDNVEDIVGLFINTIPVRVKTEVSKTIKEVLKDVGEGAIKSLDYHHTSLTEIQNETELNRGLFDHIMVFENYPIDEALKGDMNSPIQIGNVHTFEQNNYDFVITVFPGEEIKIVINYNSQMYFKGRIQKISKHIKTLISSIILNPDSQLKDLEIIPEKEKDLFSNILNKTQVVVSSTFTSEPIEEYLSYWCNKMSDPITINFSPYNQVLQQLLDAKSILSNNDGINILLIRFEDWIRNSALSESINCEKLEKYYIEFIEAFKTTNLKTTCFVGLFPPSSHLSYGDKVINKLEELYNRLERDIKEFSLVYPIDFRSIDSLYNIDEIFDPIKDSQGHTPFSDEFYAAMGTVIARKIRSLKSNKFKVIALDCDNTLWNGVCGEDGALGIQIDEPFIELQRFMLEKYNEGMLLVIISKNNESDVQEVFDNNPGMILKSEHFVTSRINWEKKSENLKSIANELNLGLDSFIFVDDSHVECTEVMTNAPEVLTLNIPKNNLEIPNFLNHIWAFDNLNVTNEDRNRSNMYLAEKKRVESSKNQISLNNFIKTLELKVSMNLLQRDDLSRVSQLTFRTNQFNLSTIRRSEKEFEQILSSEDLKCWTVRVCDRYGDYGLVGVVITKAVNNELTVDTFLLSCRVLGRNVENQILSGLKSYCKSHKIRKIRLKYIDSTKNAPVKLFLDKYESTKSLIAEKEIIYEIDTDNIEDYINDIDFYYKSLYNNENNIGKEDIQNTKSNLEEPNNSSRNTNHVKNNWTIDLVNKENLQHYLELQPLINSTAKSLLKLQLNDSKFISSEYIAPETEVEKKLTEIWQNILLNEKIGIRDNFFDLGGHSLKALRVVSQISQKLEVPITLKQIFDNPTVESLSLIIMDANKEKFVQIEAVEEMETYEVSNAQRRLWVLDQFEENSIAYSMPGSYVLEGKLSKTAFKQAYSYMIQRHESLRTVFLSVDGKPRQKTLKNPDFTIDFKDLCNGNEREARKLAQEDMNTPFDLANGPLIRFKVIMLEEKKHLLLFNMHHIISDGWSMNTFTTEFLSAYNSFKDGNEPNLVPLRIQYKDYSAWQNALLESDEMVNQRGYWLDNLSGVIPVLDLPSDNTRPAVQTFNGKRLGFNLDRGITDKLNKLTRDNNASLFMVLQTIIKTLFHRYTGQEDIILGSPVAGRTHRELENQIGFYVNTLVFRDSVTSDKTFNELLDAVATTCKDAYENQNYPFDKLVEDLDIKRDMSRSPLFDIMLVLQNNEISDSSFDNLDITLFETESSISKFDMTFTFTENSHGLFGEIEYNTDIYSTDRIERMIGHIKTLVSSILNNPGSKISELEILPEGEKNLLLNVFNDTNTDYPKDKTIIDLFEAQVDKTPDNIAVVFEDIELTYRELNEKSNIVGHYLRENYQIEPDNLVGVMLDRSEKMIIALLGILKSGAAYVPIDPDYPEDRINYMIEDSDPRLVISNRNKGIFKSLDIILESGLSILNPGKITNSKDLAYVIYTSGSTGKPKGALIEHQNVISLFSNNKFLFDFTEKDVWSIFHSFCFDFSVWEMYGALLTGAKSIIISKDTARDPNDFLNILHIHEVTILSQTPTAFYNLSEIVINSKKDIYIRYIIFGGEALSPIKLGAWNTKYPECKLINMFGITETTVHVTFKEISKYEINNNISNIGVPIPSLSTFVLDKNKMILPIGIPGELCVAGKGVCRGYLNKNQLTVQRFITNPYNKSERLYLSGDCAYIDSNGELIYQGRLDNQVQVKGFRIELGEIESSLINHPDINSAAVIVKKYKNEDKSLVAYYISDKKLDVSKLRHFLIKNLPEYMIPTHFVQMDFLPLTYNGKLNTNDLPDPEGFRTIGTEYVSPKNEVEELIAKIWEEVLHKDRISTQDNFFELGGHSINALTLVNKINKQLSSNISINDIFKHQTIRDLSKIINLGVKSMIQMDLENGLQILGEKKRKLLLNESFKKELPDDFIDIYPLSKIQQGMVFFSNLKPDEPIYHDQFVTQVLMEKYDEELFTKAIELMSKKHSILRTSFDLIHFDSYYQILHRSFRPDLVSFEDISNKNNQHFIINNYIEKDLQCKFMLWNEYLWRIKVFRLSTNKFCIILSFHHAILDGWSVSRFYSELYDFYNKLLSGEKVDLIELKSDYKKYIAINTNRSHSKNSINFWKKYLKDYSRNRLPFNFSKKKNLNVTGNAVIRKFLNKDLLNKLEKCSLKYNCNLKELLLSAHIYLLSIVTGDKKILTGTVSHNRPEIEDGEKVIGCFLNTLPIMYEVDKDINKSDFIGSIRNSLIDLKINELFLADIAEIVGAQNSEGNPLFDTIFNYTDFRETYGGIDNFDTLINNDPNINNNEMTNTLFDLETSLVDSGIYMQIKYNPAYFYAENIETAFDIYLNILENLCNDDTKMSLNMILNKHQSIIFDSDYNKTEKEYDKNKKLSDLFEEQVSKNPDNIALVYKNESLTYKEINSKSNKLARFLIDKGMSSGDHIGIISNRGFEMIIGMLGILKAGGAYIPIDPDYPQSRIDFIVKKSNVNYILQDQEYSIKCQNKYLISSSHYEDYFDGNLDIKIKPMDLAYIIYTSGSTGTPKGVMIENHSIVNLISCVNSKFSINEKDKLLFVTSMCFDLSVYDIFGILSAGGSIVIADTDQIKDPKTVMEILKKERITFWDSVPSTFNFIIDSIERNDSEYTQLDLRLVFMSGDWIPVNLPKKINKYFPNANQISLGGATEGTVWSIYYPIDHKMDYINSIPYGKPLDNNRFYILDEYQNPVPDGVPGELYIGGSGVAKGYVEDQEKNQYSFVDDIIINDGSLMYRTGDYGRMLPCGNIEFLGRKDAQVKVRGFRIELGEIESILLKNDYITTVIATAKDFGNGYNEIAIYYVSNEEISITELRDFLKMSLPDYMIPSFFVYMDALPLTSNGKVDRKSLPVPTGISNPGVEFVAPRNELEAKLVKIWQEILNIDKIGIHDNFFDLGGHSLKATRVVSKISREIKIEITLQQVFQMSTIEQLSSYINDYLLVTTKNINEAKRSNVEKRKKIKI